MHSRNDAHLCYLIALHDPFQEGSKDDDRTLMPHTWNLATASLADFVIEEVL